jgi:hypothetical protein
VGSQLLADNKLPVYGIIGQYGNMTLIDTDGQILTFAELGILKSNLGIKAYLNKPNIDDYSDMNVYNTDLLQSQIGDFVSEKWNYAYGIQLFIYRNNK